MRKKIFIVLATSIIVLMTATVFLLRRNINTNPLSDEYSEVLDSAIKNKNQSVCEMITSGRSYGDYSISVNESIDLCKAQFAIETQSLAFCLTLKEKPDSIGTISQRDVCLKGLANKLKNPKLCEQLYSGKDKQYGSVYISTCKDQALDPNYIPVYLKTPHSI